jgi:hypothetical protein
MYPIESKFQYIKKVREAFDRDHTSTAGLGDATTAVNVLYPVIEQAMDEAPPSKLTLIIGGREIIIVGAARIEVR